MLLRSFVFAADTVKEIFDLKWNKFTFVRPLTVSWNFNFKASISFENIEKAASVFA